MVIRLARPQKVGLDYFGLDVVLDDKIELMEAKCGLEGFAILIKLWQKIYMEGYYIDWEVDHAVLFSRKINAEITLVDSVVTECLSRGIFDKEIYEKFKILTSKGIQKRYLITSKQLKRSYVPMNEHYMLVNSELTSVITELTSIDSSISTQRKREEKKREDMKGKETEEEIISCSSPEPKNDLIDKNLATIAKSFEQNGFGTVNITVKELLIDILDKYPFEWIEPAMKKAVSANIRKLNYVEGILKNWNANGGMKLDSEDKPKQKPKVATAAKTRFHNFEQRTSNYTEEELEEIVKRKRQGYNKEKEVPQSTGEGLSTEAQEMFKRLRGE